MFANFTILGYKILEKTLAKRSSIIAKISRDKFITTLSKKLKNYGWNTNSGYGTIEHLKAIKKFGITKYHRKTFSPIAKFK